MRLYSIMLPGTTALLTCVCSFSVSHQMNFNVTTGAHSDVHDDDNVAASGFMIAQNSTSMEERVSQSIAISVTNKIMEALHVSQDTYMLTPDAWTHLKRLDRHVVMSFVENEKHRSLSMLNKKNDRAVRSWILRQVHEATASAERLRQAIKDHISTTHGLEIHSELLDSWMAGGGAAECMPLLSIAKESHIIENIAKKIQEEILMGWARQDVTVDAVFDMLKLSDLTERGLTYENLDTFSQYIEVHNERNPHAKTDTFTYLRNKFGGGKLGVMVLKGMNEPRFADEGFVSNAVGNDKPPVDFIGSLLSITVDVRDWEKLLDPLLAVFGGVAKLAPFLAALKKSGTRKHVEHLQRALMMRWLRSGKSVDDIFELLELSKVSKTDLTYEHLDTFVEYFSLYRSKHRYGGGAAKLAPLLAALKKSGTSRHQAEKVQNAMLKRWLVSNTKLDTVFDVLKLSELTERGLTYENLDTFSRYIEVHNERNPRAKTDTFTYLRNKFGGGKLGVMVLKGMNEPRFADEGFVSNAVGNDKPPVDFIGSLLSITVDVRDVEKLLDPLLAVFGGVAKLAPFLAALKKSGTSRHQAEQVQNAMLKRWLVRNTKLDAVFDMLELSELMEKGLTYENLDTFSRYIEVHNEQNPLAKTDTFTYLRNKFGDGKLTVMVLKGMKVPQFADEGFVFNEVGNYQLVANFIDGLLSVVVGVENLLDPLLAAFGDAAKLLTVLKIVKESGICRHEAEQLQRALLTRVAYE